MSRIEALKQEIARQLRSLDLADAVGDQELRAIVRAVRLALAEPSEAMLRAGWGGHLNLNSELGVDFARDDYARLIEAALDGSLMDEAHSGHGRTSPAQKPHDRRGRQASSSDKP